MFANESVSNVYFLELLGPGGAAPPPSKVGPGFKELKFRVGQTLQKPPAVQLAPGSSEKVSAIASILSRNRLTANTGVSPRVAKRQFDFSFHFR